MAQLMKKPLLAIFSVSLLLMSGVVYFAHHPVKPLPNDLSHLKQIRAAAEQGDPEAQYNLGVMYAKGKGVPKNHKTAVAWYRKAAEQGDPAAQFNLGVMYERGLGVSEDAKTAVEWYRQAAQQGDSMAKQRLQQLGHHEQ